MQNLDLLRPIGLEGVVGNKHELAALDALLKRKSPPHAFLFFGPSGCGKTTLARIVATRLGCNTLGVKELDATHFRGIDTIREMREVAIFRPLIGQRVAWLLDECHQLSKDAQNALLKLLEEPPDHAYFTLCTTELDKLLRTIRTRCIPVRVSTLDRLEILQLLARATKALCISPLTNSVLEKLLECATGVPRTALQLLIKVSGLSTDTAISVLDRGLDSEKKTILLLCRSLAQGAKWRTISSILAAIRAEGDEPESVRRAVLAYFTTALLREGNPFFAHVLSCFDAHMYDSGMAGLVRASFEAVHLFEKGGC